MKTTIREACERWVNGFNTIPQSVVEKLWNCSGGCDIIEITPPAVGDNVYVFDANEDGEIAEIQDDDDDGKVYVVTIDAESYKLHENDFEVERDGLLPMWGYMWAFGESIDDDWIDSEWCSDGLQALADCGFRVYESEDYGHIFGIDGAGYDFYEAHWIPLYKARGLQWHDEEDEEEI